MISTWDGRWASFYFLQVIAKCLVGERVMDAPSDFDFFLFCPQIITLERHTKGE